MKPDFEKAAKEAIASQTIYKTWENIENEFRGTDEYVEYLEKAFQHAYSIDKETIERLEKEKERLEDWKQSMIELTTPLLDWGQSKESGIRPGHSIFEEALKRCKEYPELKAKIEDLLSAMYPPNEQQGI